MSLAPPVRRREKDTGRRDLCASCCSMPNYGVIGHVRPCSAMCLLQLLQLPLFFTNCPDTQSSSSSTTPKPEAQVLASMCHLLCPVHCNLLPQAGCDVRGRGASCDMGPGLHHFSAAEGSERETSTVQAKGQCICLHAETL